MNSNFKIIFLTGHRKSGTSLTLSLFKDHPDICVFPVDPAIFYAYFGIFDKKKDSITKKKLTIRKILGHNLKNYYLEFLSEKDSEKKVRQFLKLFLSNISSKSIDSYSSVLYALAKNWMKYCKQEKVKYFLLKETSQLINYSEFIKYPLEAKRILFINIVRNPLDNYAALHDGLKSYYSKNGEDYLTLTASFIFRLLTDIKSLDLVPKKYLQIIKYEDLILNPSIVMKEICKYLKINFNENLLLPKINASLSYKGNSYDKIKSTGLSKRNINNWKNRIDNETAVTIEFFFQEIMKKFNYKLQFNSKIYSQQSFKTIKDINKKFFYKAPLNLKNS